MQKVSEIRLKPCPVCGKIPKVKRNYAYEASGYGASLACLSLRNS